MGWYRYTWRTRMKGTKSPRTLITGWVIGDSVLLTFLGWVSLLRSQKWAVCVPSWRGNKGSRTREWEKNSLTGWLLLGYMWDVGYERPGTSLNFYCPSSPRIVFWCACWNIPRLITEKSLNITSCFIPQVVDYVRASESLIHLMPILKDKQNCKLFHQCRYSKTHMYT